MKKALIIMAVVTAGIFLQGCVASNLGYVRDSNGRKVWIDGKDHQKPKRVADWGHQPNWN